MDKFKIYVPKTDLSVFEVYDTPTDTGRVVAKSKRRYKKEVEVKSSSKHEFVCLKTNLKCFQKFLSKHFLSAGMYSRISNESYRDIPLANFPDNRQCPNYVYSSVADLSVMEMPTATEEELSWCRSIGILQSFHGQFYICEMNSTGGVAPNIKIHVSVVYLRSPQYTAMLQSLVVPSPVQMFGSIRWLSRKKVFFIKIMQVLTVPKALHMRDAVDQLIVLKSSQGLN